MKEIKYEIKGCFPVTECPYKKKTMSMLDNNYYIIKVGTINCKLCMFNVAVNSKKKTVKCGYKEEK